MERRAPADNNAPHFLDMMVRALRAVDLVANLAALPAPVILATTTGPRAAAKQARQLPTPVNKRPTLNSSPVSSTLPILGKLGQA